MFLYAHAPRPIRSPSGKREGSEHSRERTIYPDYEQSFVIEEAEALTDDEEPENNHVITIDI
tara:strand:- start:607 stop:792 length:186 start_codon:yes stop_codon:yes gene_type:complete